MLLQPLAFGRGTAAFFLLVFRLPRLKYEYIQNMVSRKLYSSEKLKSSMGPTSFRSEARRPRLQGYYSTKPLILRGFFSLCKRNHMVSFTLSTCQKAMKKICIYCKMLHKIFIQYIYHFDMLHNIFFTFVIFWRVGLAKFVFVKNFLQNLFVYVYNICFTTRRVFLAQLPRV